MVTRTAMLRLQLQDAVSGPARGTSAALGKLEKSVSQLGRKGTPGAKKLIDQMEQLQRKSAAVGEFRELRRGLKQTSAEFQAAKSRAQELQRALSASPSRKLAADMRSAQSAVKAASEAFRAQGNAVRAAEQALRTYGINSRAGISASQKAIRGELAQTIREMRRLDQEARRTKAAPAAPVRRPGAGSSSGAAGLVGGGAVFHTGQRGIRAALTEGLSFDQAFFRRDALGGFSAEESARMNRQAEQIGRDTEYTNADVVGAQMRIMQSGIHAVGQIETLTDAVTDYSRAMGVTLTEGAESLTAIALIKGVSLSSSEAISRLVDRQVWAAKNSGMDDSDLYQAARYGGTPGRIAGLSDDTIMAIAMTLRRSGIRGDEGGVAARALASKLVAPTNKGRMALQSMGLNYADYMSNPDAFAVHGFESMLQENFGWRLSDEGRERLASAWDQEFVDDSGESVPVGSHAGEFISRTMDALTEEFGELSATDRRKAADRIGKFHAMSAGSIDTERLLDDILAQGPSLIQANAMFTDRQGGRIAILARNRETFEENREKMRTTPEGVARRIGEDATRGLYGDFMRMTGTLETALTRMSQDLEGVSRPLIRTIDATVEGFLDLPRAARQVVEAFGAAALAFGGYAAYRGSRNLLGGLLGSGASGAGAAATSGAGGAVRGLLGRGLLVGIASYLGEKAIEAGLESVNSKLYTPEQRQRAEEKLRTGGIWSREFWSGHGDQRATQSGRARSHLQGGLAKVTADWPAAAQQGVQSYIQALAAGGAEAEAEAGAIGQAIERELSVTGNPDVNTARLERALSIARQLAAVMRSELGGGASTNVDGSPVVGGSRSSGGAVEAGKTYAIGKRPEFFTPSRDGMVTTQHPSGGMIHAPVTVSITVNGSADTSTIRQLEAAAERAVRRAMSGLDNKLNRGNRMPFTDLQFGDM